MTETYELDLSGYRFGKLICLWPLTAKCVYWICLCDCGTECKKRRWELIANKSTQCNNCFRLQQSLNTSEFNRLHRKDKHPKWKGVGDLSGAHWAQIRSNARKRNLPVEISIGYAWEIYLQQNKTCAMTGLPIGFSYPFSWESITASLDRIDNSLGYIDGNVQWVHKDIQLMRMHLPQDHFIHMCKLVALFN